VRWVRLSNGYKVWTQRIGQGSTKVLLLHGGPGLSHDYMDCFADFLPRAGYELYFYDQLGSGRSDRPSDPALWTLERYVHEVEEVRTGLELDQFVLIGHSWGSALGMEYALSYQQHLSALVLSNMTDNAADYDSYMQKLKNALPPPVLRRLNELERSGKQDSPEYQKLFMTEFFARHACRLTPTPPSLERSFSVENASINNQVVGSGDFVMGGEFTHWDRRAQLPRIRVPTLTMGARYDFMNHETIKQEAQLIPGAECFISATGSHLAMWDDQTHYFQALLAFLAKHRPA
jgi:proline iminopeptidase